MKTYSIKSGKKACTKCDKITSSFYVDKSTKDGLSCRCKDCIKSSVKKYRMTKEGFVSKMYGNQRESSKCRRHKMPEYKLEEFRGWLFAQEKFHILYDKWVQNNFDVKLAPSVDRLDDYKGYMFDNIQLMTWEENQRKYFNDKKNGINNKTNRAVIQLDKNNNEIKRFHSIREAGRITRVAFCNISECCRSNRKTAGNFKWIYG